MEIYPSLIDRLKNQHEAIPNILGAIDNGRLTIQPQPGKWNIHDNIAHLARYQNIFIDRINTIALEDSPRFNRYKAEDDPHFESWRALAVDTLTEHMVTDRKAIYVLVTGSGTDLSRKGIHEKFGALNLIQWTEFFLLHEAHHIFTIFRLAYDTGL